jgi:SulP family sulfate permease
MLGLGAAAVWLWGLEGRGVQIMGEIPSGLPDLALPPMDLATLQALAPLALVGFAQTIAIGKTLAQRQGRDVRANQELVALGLANMASSLSQAFPVSGGLSRSMVNARPARAPPWPH